MEDAAKWLFRKTLNNVWFGIFMMVLVGSYVAIGSGRPQVREYFEMDELAFFQAWPLKLIMILLVANLTTVTFIRIPFTVPRYGVWMIHAGIVTLIYGMAYYYSYKEEGLAFVAKGATVSSYYDRWDRSLYVRVDGMNTGDEHVLKSLPRFSVRGEKSLNSPDLRDIHPVVVMEDRATPLEKMVALDAPLQFDVIGYWPYAEIVTSYMQVPGNAGGKTGIKLTAKDVKGEVLKRAWVVAEGMEGSHVDFGELEMEHRHVGDTAAQTMLAQPLAIHMLEITAGGETKSLPVDIGQTVNIGGYALTIESFDPAWRTMDRQVVQLLTLMVKPPTGPEFRRQVIPGREKITDWKLNEPGAGPMGKRQDAPIDPALITRYTFSDPLGLLPHGGETNVKRTFVTTPTRTYVVSSSLRGPTTVAELAGGKGALPFGQGEGSVTVEVERADNVRRVDSVVETPKEKRDRNVGESGMAQVLSIRVSSGNWSDTVFVPFTTWALTAPWREGNVKLPNGRQIQLQLGNRTRLIAPDRTGRPAQVRLDDFELKSYAGGSAMSGMQRDFISSLTVTEPDGNVRTGKAHMNSPIYFGPAPITGLGDTYWTLFQAQWDPQGQRFTVLGVGNRPGIWIMTAGSVMTVTGLLYAFYLKPLIIKRRKNKAIEEAEAKGKKVRRPVVVEGMEGRVSV